MRVKVKLKKYIVLVGTVIMIAVCLSRFIMEAQAYCDTWMSLEFLDMRKNTGEGQHSLKDIDTYSGNYTNDIGKIYADVWHYFDHIKLETDSRLTYGRKIRVDAGQQLNIVAAKEDTADAGGETTNAGLKFYWSIAEYDEYGNIVFDGGWRQSGDTWKVGYTGNSDTGYGKDGYPNGVNAETRKNDVHYVVPIFRWNNGDESVGSGSELIYARDMKVFPVFSLITAPFTYTFDLNGGNIGGSTDSYIMQRLGTSTVSVPDMPQRNGYTFAGWKITSQGGKQKGRTYTSDQLTIMFRDGKYYSSLFEDATFEAQWDKTSYKVSYDADGGTLYDESGNKADNPVKIYNYDEIYNFYTAQRAYAVSYDPNGGTASIETENTNAQAIFNGWNENLDKDTNHGIVDGTNAYTTGTWNWAAYYNGNPDLLNTTGNIYDTIWAIQHYRSWGSTPEENRQFHGDSYWIPTQKFKNLTSDGQTVYVKANYTNGSVVLPKAEKESCKVDGSRIKYVFDGWYSDSALTRYVGTTGNSFTPDSDMTLYAKFIEVTVDTGFCVRVEHYKMDTSGDYPSVPSDTDVLSDQQFGTELKLSEIAKNYTGFIYNAIRTNKENDNLIVNENIVIKLYYDREQYTVTYDYKTNGGTSAGSQIVKVYYGAEADLSIDAVKAGWNHIGWNTNSETISGMESCVVIGDVTLYAIYKKDITVEFVDFEKTFSKKVTIYNKQQSGKVDVPVITGYPDWSGVSDVKTVGFNSVRNINEDRATICEVQSGMSGLVVTENRIYYAVCEADVTLQYVLNGGIENETTHPVTEVVYCNAANPGKVKGVELQLGESIKPSYDDAGYIHSYTFSVWAENSENSENRYDSNTAYILKENTVMYALWTENIEAITYTVAYDGNKGAAVKNIPGLLTVDYDEDFPVSTEIPVRDGFTFINWNTRADGTGTVLSTGQITKNLTVENDSVVTLYAQWKQRKPQIVSVASNRGTGWKFVKRTLGDDEWYHMSGRETVKNLENISNEDCIMVVHIDKDGTIIRVQ